jgi:hypothetical protein
MNSIESLCRTKDVSLRLKYPPNYPNRLNLVVLVSIAVIVYQYGSLLVAVRVIPATGDCSHRSLHGSNKPFPSPDNNAHSNASRTSNPRNVTTPVCTSVLNVWAGQQDCSNWREKSTSSSSSGAGYMLHEKITR